MNRLLLVVGAVLFALGAAALVLPDRILVERSISINRPATTVYTLLNGFSSWSEWSPWVARDATVTVTRSGPERGPGARIDWSGDPSKAGLGTQEIIASDPPRLITLTLSQGTQGEASLQYLIDGDALGTRLTWTFEADATMGEGFQDRLIGRFYGWFLVRWVVADFERGLASFKAYAESLPGEDFSQAEITRVQVAPLAVARVTNLRAATPEGVAEAVADAFGAISAWALRHDVEFQGQPFIITRHAAPGSEVYEAAVPIGRDVLAPEEGVVGYGETPSGQAACLLHRGSTLETLASYEQLNAWVRAHGLETTGISWEHYLSDPSITPSSSTSLEICTMIAGEEP